MPRIPEPLVGVIYGAPVSIVVVFVLLLQPNLSKELCGENHQAPRADLVSPLVLASLLLAFITFFLRLSL